VAFNPELVSTYFVVPGLVAIVLTMICALLTSVALTREKETGTLEQMLMTPVSPVQVVVGKLLPYMSIGVLDAALILALGRLVFDVPMNGSWWVLAGYSLLFVLISLALGLLISTIASTQRVAMMVALLATFLPSLILSGFVFAQASMPLVLRALGQAIPATHYLTVIRGVMLVGTAWYPVQGGVMLAMLIVLLAVSTRKFRVTLE
jgi:ABC-2 type transport system permease protein